MQDAITRANLYVEAGADAVYVEAPISKQELAVIGKKVKGLRVVGMLEGGMTPLLTPAEAKDLGFHIITYPLSAPYAALRYVLCLIIIICSNQAIAGVVCGCCVVCSKQ